MLLGGATGVCVHDPRSVAARRRRARFCAAAMLAGVVGPETLRLPLRVSPDTGDAERRRGQGECADLR